MKRLFTSALTWAWQGCFPLLLWVAMNGLFVAQVSAAVEDLKINEVRAQRIGSPAGGFLYPFIELYNAGQDSLALSGWSLVASQTTLNLPAWVMPPQTFLHIRLGSGPDRADFSSGLALYYSQDDSTQVFAVAAGEVGLYQGAVSGPNIMDFVAWSDSGSYAGRLAYGHAVSKGIWQAGDFVDLRGVARLSTLGLCPDGLDRDQAFDWRELDWGTYFIQPLPGPNNFLHIYPPNGSVMPNTPSRRLLWASVSQADSFLVEVDEDPTFASPEIVAATSDTFLELDLGFRFDQYHWRVSLLHEGNWLETGPAWSFDLLPEGFLFQSVANFQPLVQHKDSRMLCDMASTWDSDRRVRIDYRRPGCLEEKVYRDLGRTDSTGPWDQPHPSTLEHVRKCEHCDSYCARASIAMINHAFGGDLSQDRISYEIYGKHLLIPENDLGHAMGADSTHAHRALGLLPSQVRAINENSSLAWKDIKDAIDAGKPILVLRYNPFDDLAPVHSTVIHGYFETGSDAYLQVADPYPRPDPTSVGSRFGGSLVYRYDAWLDDLEQFYLFFLPAGASLTGTTQEAGLGPADDQDGDGILDFDEENRFCSDKAKSDTDRDDLPDKVDIKTYVFHNRDDGSPHDIDEPVAFPDIDGDTQYPQAILFPECDCNSDNDNDFDGGEEILGDGVNQSSGTHETCVFDPNDQHLSIYTTKSSSPAINRIFRPGENVILFGGSFHKGTVYDISIIKNAPILTDGMRLPMNKRRVRSNENRRMGTLEGYFSGYNLGKFNSGHYTVVVDVAHDSLFSTHCKDPVWSFEVRGTQLLGLQGAFSDSLYFLDSAGFVPERIIPMTLTGKTITGGNDLDFHPCWGTAFAILNSPGLTGRQWVVLDTATGMAILLGDLKDNFASVTFTPDGKLYGITADSANSPAALFRIDPQTADTTWLADLGTTSSGEALAFCPDNGSLYRAFGQDSAMRFATIDTGSLQQTLIPYSPSPFDKVLDMVYVGGGIFWASMRSGEIMEIDTSGQVGLTGFFPAPRLYSGMTFPVVSLVAAFSPTTYGLAVDFSDFSSGEITGWSWDFGDGGQSLQQHPTHHYAQPGTYPVTLSISSEGCGSRSYTDWVDVGCDAPPADFEFTVSSQSVSFKALFPAAAYLWDFGDGSSSTQAEPTHNYFSPGLYTVCLSTGDSCGRDSSCIEVLIECPVPQAAFIYQQNQLTVDFYDVSIGNTAGTWIWDFGDAGGSTQPNPSHTYASSGTYSVCLTVNNSCGNQTFCHPVEISVTGIGEEMDFLAVELFPNPTDGILLIRLELPTPGKVRGALFSLEGRQLLTFSRFASSGTYEELLNLGSLPGGMYLLKIRTGQGVLIGKVVKQDVR